MCELVRVWGALHITEQWTPHLLVTSSASKMQTTPPTSLTASHSSKVTNASSLRSFFPFFHLFSLCSLLFPALAISSSPSSLVTSCHVSSPPPFSLLCSLLLPPSCPAICQPVLVSSHNWPAGNNRSLINTKYWATPTLLIVVTV